MSLLCAIIIIWALGYALYYIGYGICIIITFFQISKKTRDKRRELERIFAENQEYREGKIKNSTYII